MLVNLYSFQLDKQMSLENIIFQILYSSNFRSIIRNMFEFLVVHLYWTHCILQGINSLDTEIKKFK